MDLRVLSFCEAIGRLGSFTRAADEIHIAQPALSTAVAKLEDELGVTLFQRLPRGATPTPEGKILLARAARIFDEVDSLKRELSDATELRSGLITVGFPPMFGLYYFPKLIMAFRTVYPGVEIRAVEGSATSIRQKLIDGDIDIGILETRRIDKEWESVRLGRDEMVLAVARSHPLAALERIKPADLNHLPMVVLTSDFLQRQLLDGYCERHRVHYRQVMECNFVQMTVAAATENHGAATLLRLLVDSQPGLCAVSFEPKMPFSFGLCWIKNRYVSMAGQALIAFASQMAEAPGRRGPAFAGAT